MQHSARRAIAPVGAEAANPIDPHALAYADGMVCAQALAPYTAPHGDTSVVPRILQRWLRGGIERLATDDPRRPALETEWRFQQLYRFEDLPSVIVESSQLNLGEGWLERLGEDAADHRPFRRVPRALWIADRLFDTVLYADKHPDASPDSGHASTDQPGVLKLDEERARSWLTGFRTHQPLAAIERGALPVLMRSTAALRLLRESEEWASSADATASSAQSPVLGLKSPLIDTPLPPSITAPGRKLDPQDLATIAKLASRLNKVWPRD